MVEHCVPITCPRCILLAHTLPKHQWVRRPSLEFTSRILVLSATEGIVDGRTDSTHDFVVNTTERPRERVLQNGVEAVAIDDRRLVDARVVVVEVDFGR